MHQRRSICVTGLPRSGSTLLCQILATHPEIHCDGMSSPLFGALQALRSHLSDSEFLLSQLDGAFDRIVLPAGVAFEQLTLREEATGVSILFDNVQIAFLAEVRSMLLVESNDFAIA